MKGLHKALLPLALASSLLVMGGCTNFLTGGDIKNQLEEEIEMAKISNPLKVSYYAPTYQSGGTYSDAVIEITFNRGIKPETFSYSIKDSLTNENLTSCYSAPEFYRDNAVVKIRPSSQNAVEVPKGSVRDITVTLSKYIRDADGIRF